MRAARSNRRWLGAIKTGAKVVILDIAGVSHLKYGHRNHGLLFWKGHPGGRGTAHRGCEDNVLELFRITRLDHIIPLFPDVDSAFRETAGWPNSAKN